MTVDVVRDLSRVVDSLSPEQNQVLEQWSDQLQGLLNTAVSQGGPAARRVKNWLNGVWLGHPLHPALTDAAIGAWSTGAMLDLVGAKREADAAITVGVLSAIPTAFAGAADWADTSDEPRRIGLIHALLNSVGLTCMIASLFARRANQRHVGIGLSTLGLSLTSISAWLGGETRDSWKTRPVSRVRPPVSLMDLTPGVNYAIQVRSLGNDGYSDWSDSVTKMCT